MIKRTLALIVATLAGLPLLAAPAHATPVPSPSPSPTASAPAGPCALPTPSPDETIEVPKVAKVAEQTPAPNLRRIPRLPLPVACFVEFKDLCEGETEVTLHNPIPHVTIVYQVAEEGSTRSVGFGESETTTIASVFSPFRVWIVFDAEHKLPIAKHTYHEPKGCQSPSPSPSVSDSESPEPQLPVTGRDLTVPIGIAGGSLVGLVLLLGVLELARARARRRRSAA
jgi:hypothetical protein